MVGPWEFFSAPSAQTAVEELERFQSTYGQDSVLKLARLQGPDAGQWAAKGCAEIQRVGYGMDVYSDPGSDETTCATSLAVDDTSSWHSLHKEHWAADDPSARPEPQTLEAVRAVLVKPSERRTHRDVDTLLPVLQRIRAISTLPEIAQRALCIVADFVQLQQGTYLYRRGDACDAVYVVLSGSVQLIIPGNPTGIYPDDILMGVVREGVGFGDVALLYTINRNADAFAQDSDCALLRLRLHDYTLITNAIQTEELLKVCQVPSNDRTGQSLRLIKRIVCDNVPYFSGNSEEQKIEFARAFQLEYWDTAGQHVFQANSPAEAMYVSLSCTVDLPAKSSSRRKAGLARTSSVMQGEVEKLSGRGDKDTLVKIQKDNPNEENCQQEGHVASGTKATFEGVMERKVTLNETHATGALPRFSRQPSDESRASHSPYPRTKSTLDSLVARNSSANSIAQAHPGDVFGASDAATPSMSLHTTSARIVNPGYLLVLSRDKLQQILNGCQEESDAQVRLTECVCLAFQIRDHQQRHTEAQTKFFSSNVAAGAGAEREELLQRLVACFTLHKLRAGDSLVLQRRTVEEVFVIQSGNCDVKVELDSVKSNDRRGHRKQVKVAALGQNALVGLSDAFFNAGTGMATYEATTRMLVYKANLGKILGLLECYQPVKANLRATFKNILMTWANRLSQSLSIIQDSCKKSGEGDVTTTWARQQLNLFLHPDAPRAAAVVSEVDTEASIDKANTPSLREHPELLSDFKSQLLQDDMSVVKRIANVREKQQAGRQHAPVLSGKGPLVPQLNTNKAILTKHRMDALATSRHHKMLQSWRSQSPSELCMWGGLQMTRGAWLTERVARNTAWLKPYLGIKYSEHASARQNPLEGRFAEKAAAALQRCKTPPHSWNNVLRSLILHVRLSEMSIKEREEFIVESLGIDSVALRAKIGSLKAFKMLAVKIKAAHGADRRLRASATWMKRRSRRSYRRTTCMR